MQGQLIRQSAGPAGHQRPASEDGSSRANPEGSGRGNREVTVGCGLAGADLAEEDRGLGDLVNLHPGPEAGSSGNRNAAGVQARGVPGETGHIAVLVINHVQVSIDVDLDHVHVLPSPQILLVELIVPHSAGRGQKPADKLVGAARRDAHAPGAPGDHSAVGGVVVRLSPAGDQRQALPGEGPAVNNATRLALLVFSARMRASGHGS